MFENALGYHKGQIVPYPGGNIRTPGGLKTLRIALNHIYYPICYTKMHNGAWKNNFGY